MDSLQMSKQLVAEMLGTALLLATVVGSGIMGERLADGNLALALLGNTLATGAILVVIILIFEPISGAHFNPAVTLSFLIRREISAHIALLYLVAQIIGALLGTFSAHFMFEEPIFQLSTQSRTGNGQWLSETIATFGLIATILSTLRWRPNALPYAVGLFISAGYWFTASTSFANPAVTLARSLTDTFSGINPSHTPWFILAELVGAVLATGCFGWLLSQKTTKPI